jgi:predicted PolB exonuclease-like 3'-5' exonuclease
MDVLAKHNGRGNAPLDDLAKLCGFPGKMGMDGSQVWHAWTHGQAQEVRAYCETDVVNTWLVYCRFRLLRGELDTASYEAEIALVRETLEQSTEPHWKQYLEAWGR